MLVLLLSILPLAAGAAVSPTVLIVQLANVDGPGGSRPRGMAYAAGAMAVLAVVSVLALALARGSGGAHSSSGEVAVVELAIAAILIALGTRGLVAKERKRKPQAPDTPVAAQGARMVALGAAMMATNFSSLALYFPAMHAIGVSDDGTFAQIVAFVVLFAAATLTAWLPLLPAGALHDSLRPRLEAANEFLQRRAPWLMPAIVLGLGIYLALLGLGRLL